MFKRKNKKILPTLALALAFLLWGFNTVFIKVSVDSMPVTLFLFIRFTLATLILLPFALRKRKKLKFKVKSRIILSSLIGLSAFMLLMGEGLKRTSALDTAVIFLIAPVVMYVLSIEILKEKFNPKILFGLIIALIGAGLVVVSPVLNATGSTDGRSFVGNLIVLVSVFIAVLGTVMVKQVLKKAPPIQVTTLRFAVVPISMLPILYYQRPDIFAINWSSSVILSLTYSILIGSVLSYSIYHWALKKISGEQSSVFHYLDPLGGVIGSIIFLNDTLTPIILLGASLTVLGVYLSEAKPKLHIHHLHAHR